MVFGNFVEGALIKGNIWEAKAASQDYAAAQKYLALLFTDLEVKRLVKSLRTAPTMEYEAKDLLRASQTHLLEKDSPHVAEDLRKIKKGKKLDPRSLIAAEFMILGTSLSKRGCTAKHILAVYRLRWQIELAFKRLKSLLHIDRLPTRTAVF